MSKYYHIKMIARTTYVKSHFMWLRFKVKKRRLEEREKGSGRAHDAIQAAKVACWKAKKQKLNFFNGNLSEFKVIFQKKSRLLLTERECKHWQRQWERIEEEL